MNIILQSDPAWAAARIGKVTASRMDDLTAKTKTGWGTGRANYMAALIAERLTGAAMENYVNAAMQWGIDTEAEGRTAYEFHTDASVSPGGFVVHGEIAEAGASPDGFVGADGLLEIKCPITSTHIDTLISATVPSKYIKQMQFQMCCTGTQWCDFVSYDPRMPESMRLFIKRVPRDDAIIAELETAVREFLAELETKLGKLQSRYEPTPKVRQHWDEMKLVTQAGIRCSDVDFRRWICGSGDDVPTAEMAAEAVRRHCGIKSRTELDNDAAAALLWGELNREYENWKHERP